MIKDLLICFFASLNILMFSFIGLNYDAVKKNFEYQAFASMTENQNFEEITNKIQNALAGPLLLNFSVQNSKNSSSPLLYLSIPKINLTTPVSMTKKQEEIKENLLKGAITLNQFAPPSSKGQTVIFGHSSDYPWNNNPYGTVFTLLPKLQKGDLIAIFYGKEKYSYRVEKVVVTDDNLTGLISQNTPGNQLILTTCYPIGFMEKRFNVITVPVSV